MWKWAYRFSFGNPRMAAIVFGFFSIIQFTVETLFLLCFAVYVATPISTVTKVFYAMAGILSPLLLVLSVLFVYSAAKNEHRWMIPWIGSYFIVALAEIVFTVIAFILLSDFHEIFQFFTSAWALSQYQAANQLFIGNTTSCVPVSSLLFSGTDGGVYYAALFSQQGAQGVIAFCTLVLLFKNFFNVIILSVSLIAYQEIRDGRGRVPKSSSTRNRTSSYYDPHLRVASASRVRRPFTSINSVTR